MQTNPKAVPDYNPNQSVMEDGIARDESQKSIITGGSSILKSRLS